MDDIRLEGKPLPLPPAMNGTQWGQATTARNVERKCLSRTNCKPVDCKSPLVCVDNWNEAVCAYVLRILLLLGIKSLNFNEDPDTSFTICQIASSIGF